MAQDKELYRRGGSTAFATQGGRVKLELWFENMEPNDDPLRAVMTPGQALELIGRLSDAAKSALTDSMK